VEGLAPPLACLIEIQSALQNGEAVRQGLARYLRGPQSGDPYAQEIRNFIFAWDQGQDWKSVIRSLASPHRRALLEIAAVGLSGQPIQAHLNELQVEMTEACDLEIRRHLELLPLKMLLPLLLFQFPAYLLLMFGPLLKRLLEELSR
jgi:hypothetical protein